jgi:hypothetical protein
MATESSALTPAGAAARRPGARRSRRTGAVDGLTAVLFSIAAFLAVLALLAGELPAGGDHSAARRVIVQRRIYQTTIVETVTGGGASSAAAVTQSVSNSSSGSAVSAAPTTRTSG